jgi:hypothetical protein
MRDFLKLALTLIFLTAASSRSRAQNFDTGQGVHMMPWLMTTITDCSATVGTSAVNLITAPVAWKTLTIMNVSSGNIGVSFTTTASIGAAGTYTLVPNGSFTAPVSAAWSKNISVIASASGSAVSCTLWN